MKNYLVKALHRISDTTWWDGKDRADEGDLYSYYEQMDRLSEASCMQFLQGDWEYIRLESTASDISHALRQQFRAIWDLWSSEPCNIYYVSADSLLMQPLEIFGKPKHFSLFNYSDPKSIDGFEHYLNADIRYYPAEMDRAIFEQAVADLDQATQWGDTEKLYNRMVWSQGLPVEQVINPLLAYQAKWIPGTQRTKNTTDEWNGCLMDDSFAVHWYGTKSAVDRVRTMKISVGLLQIPEIPVNPRPAKTIDISHLP